MQYILITGASTGIGYDASKYLLEKDYFVFGSVRKEEDGKRLKSEFGTNFKALIFDVRDVEAINLAKAEVAAILGERYLTGLINNAGIGVSGPSQHIPIEEYERQFDVNFFGVLKVSQAFLPLLGAQFPQTDKPGKMINISSIASIFTNPFMAPYSSSKAALESLSDGFRRELRMYGIDVVSVQPGPILSAIWIKSEIKPGNSFEGTDYEPMVKPLNKLLRKASKSALDASVLSELIFKILNKKNPKTRYLAVKNKWNIWAGKFLPDKVLDNIIWKQMKKVFERK